MEKNISRGSQLLQFCYPYILLCFNAFMNLFLSFLLAAGAWAKVCHLSQSSPALDMIGAYLCLFKGLILLTTQHIHWSFGPSPRHTDHISNLVILNNDYISLLKLLHAFLIRVQGPQHVCSTAGYLMVAWKCLLSVGVATWFNTILSLIMIV